MKKTRVSGMGYVTAITYGLTLGSGFYAWIAPVFGAVSGFVLMAPVIADVMLLCMRAYAVRP